MKEQVTICGKRMSIVRVLVEVEMVVEVVVTWVFLWRVVQVEVHDCCLL